MTTVLSDTPRSLRRRWYTDKGRVDEHFHAITCKCVKCVIVAEERPKLGPDVTPAGPRRPGEEEQGFVWLLQKVGESTKKRLGLPLCVPETLVMAKGKPDRLYFVDPEDGVPAQMGGWARHPRLQVSKASKVDLPFGVLLKTFYRLHRTRWTEKRPEPPPPPKRTRSRSGSPGRKRLLKPKNDAPPFDVRSDEMLRVLYADASSGFLTESMVRSQLRDEKFARTCRPGKCAVVGEGATSTQRNDSFWQEVVVVQTVPWKDPEYISYRYHADGARQATELEERYGQRSRAVVGGRPVQGERSNIEEQVLRLPLAISDYLREHHDLDLVSGTFELVHDRNDGVLWLANAVSLRVAPADRTVVDVESSVDDFVGTVRYFREEQFLKTIDAHEQLCKGREDLRSERNEQRYLSALKKMSEPEQAKFLLRCKISDEIYPQDLLDKFAPYRIVKLYYPLQGEGENDQAFLEFASAQDRRGALSLAESTLNGTVLQIGTSTKVRLAEALGSRAFDTYDGPGLRGPGAIGDDDAIDAKEEPPRIPVFMDTMEAEMRDWFYKAEPVHPPDPVGEVLRHIGAETRDPPGGGFSQRFEPSPLDIRLCHAPEQEPDFVVSGAGGKGCLVNGPYKRKWVRNDHPMYQKVGGTAIIYFQGFWKMHDCDDTERWYYAVKEACGPEPPTGRWSCYGYTEGDAMPPPTVTKVVPSYPHCKDVSLWQSRVCKPRLARSSSVCETEMRKRAVQTPELMATWAHGLGPGPVKPDSPSRLGTLGTTDWSRTASTWASSNRPGSVLSRASTARSQLQRTASWSVGVF